MLHFDGRVVAEAQLGGFTAVDTRFPFILFVSQAQRGVSLLELIVFIVIVGIAVVGVLAALSLSSRTSADPMIQKQALSIAEAVMEEIQLMPFTYCDPEDPQAATAQSATAGPTACSAAAGIEVIGAETAVPYGPETRLDATTPFDNVNDYHAFGMTGVTDIAGNAITGLGDYTATVAVAAQGVAAVGAVPAIPADAALLITVTVTHPNLTMGVVLHGYRMRYAPNALP
jgi:MSHA pilin protein MshD